MGEPGSILERLHDIFPFHVGVFSQDLFHRGAMGNLANKYRNGNAHPPDAGPPMILGSKVILSNIFSLHYHA